MGVGVGQGFPSSLWRNSVETRVGRLVLQLSLVGGSGYVPAGLEWSRRDAENLVLARVNSRMNESECLQ